MIDTNTPENNQNIDKFNDAIEKSILEKIDKWNKNIPKTKYKIVIVKQKRTNIINVFTLQQRYGMRGKSKSLARFLPNTINDSKIGKLAEAIKRQNPNIEIEIE